MSVREMVTAYTAFSNKGLRVDPIYVTKITDNNGNVISEFTPQYTEVMSQEAYFKMVNILQNVINSGTGSRLRRAPLQHHSRDGRQDRYDQLQRRRMVYGLHAQPRFGRWEVLN